MCRCLGGLSEILPGVPGGLLHSPRSRASDFPLSHTHTHTPTQYLGFFTSITHLPSPRTFPQSYNPQTTPRAIPLGVLYSNHHSVSLYDVDVGFSTIRTLSCNLADVETNCDLQDSHDHKTQAGTMGDGDGRVVAPSRRTAPIISGDGGAGQKEGTNATGRRAAKT